MAINLIMKKGGEIKKVNLPFRFFSKKDSVGDMNKKVISYAKDLGYIALSYEFPFSGNKKYKLGEIIKL